MILNVFRKIGIMLAVIVSITSCQKFELGDEFLEKPPAGDLTIDEIYSNAVYARRALWAAYHTLPSGFCLLGRHKLGDDVLECLTDLNSSTIKWGGCGNEFYYPGTVTAAMENWSGATKCSYTGNSGEMHWIGIRRAYLFLANVDAVPDMSDAEKTQLKAEAKAIIALHYCEIFRHFGGLPWIDHAYVPSEDLAKERETALQTLNNIVDLLDEASADLPWTIADPVNWDGRLTKAATMGLKARILLFGASPLFNSATPYMAGEASDLHLTWYGSYMPELWQRALKAHEDFFNEMERQGGYKLVTEGSNYRAIWRKGYLERNNGETLISIRERQIFQQEFGEYEYIFPVQAGQNGIVGITQEFVDLFPMANGKSIADADSGFDPDFPYKDRDPRMYESVITNGDWYNNYRFVELFVDGHHYQAYGANTCWGTGYGIRKFVLDGCRPPDRWYETYEGQGMELHYPYLRLPELYFGYAEAICQTGGDMNKAYNLANAMRTRVGVGGMKPGLTGAAFIDALLTERAVELAFEEVRWFDIIRYKRDDIFKKQLHYVEITKKDASEDPPVSFNYEYKPILPARNWAANFSEKWYLSAFPSNEINKGYGLIQNPGW